MTEQRNRNRLTLLLIVAIFVGPIVIAWLFASGVFDWRARGLVNQGELVNPPLDLSAHAQRPAISRLFSLQPSEWAMVYVEPTSCSEVCGKHLDDLLKVREVLGQNAVRASVHALARDSTVVPALHTGRVYQDAEAVTAIQTEFAAHGPTFTLPAIVFIDWRHQLMMRYAPDAPLSEIKKDLQRLLRASAIH